MGSIPVRVTMIAEHYRWNGEKASHLKGFGNFLFSKFFGSSIDEITDGRGFEPLFFHIQADFQWQRPFSEGCGGEIPEKTKKNLSQS